jgi:hypothetical protein
MSNECSCGGRWFVYPGVDEKTCLGCGKKYKLHPPTWFWTGFVDEQYRRRDELDEKVRGQSSCE